MLTGSEKKNNNFYETNATDLFDLFFNKNPNNVPDGSRILISGEEVITFGELPNLIRKCAYNLQKQFGIKKGDMVAIRSLPHINYPIVMMAVVYAGGTIAFVRRATGDDFDSIFQEIEAVKPKLFIFGSEESDFSLEVAAKAGIPVSNTLVLDNNIINGVDSVKDILLSGNNIALPCTFTAEFENHCSYIFFTSGSTGKKKAVQITNKAMVHCLTHYPKKKGLDRVLANRAFCYGSVIITTLAFSIFHGDEVYISQVEDINDICRDIEKYKITVYSTSPYVITRVVKEEVYKKYDLSSLTRLIVGGAVMTKSAIGQAKQAFGISILYKYGSSEMLTIFDTTPELSSQGAVGRLKPEYTVRLVDEDDNEVELGQPGELLIKGPTMTKGYYNNPEATVKAFTNDGFFRTGDVFTHVGDGVYKFMSRCSNLMKYQTTRIFPHEIEKMVLTHPKVADCGVIGVFSHEQSTDLPRAYVTLVNKEDYLNKEELAREILEYTNKQLPEMKQIRAGVIIKETLPRTASDKIIYNILKQEAEAEQNQ